MEPLTPRWTPAEDALALSLVATGLSAGELNGKIPGRTGKAVKTRARYISLSSEERHLQNVRKIRIRSAPRSTVRTRVMPALSANAPPPEVMADAERRASAWRTLTAIAFGDPPPWSSALDRRAVQA